MGDDVLIQAPTVPQMIIDLLKEHGPLTRSELMEALGKTSNQMSMPISSLMKKGLIHQYGYSFNGRRHARRYALKAGMDQTELLRFIKKMADAKRYRSGKIELIEAKYADEANVILKGGRISVL